MKVRLDDPKELARIHATLTARAKRRRQREPGIDSSTAPSALHSRWSLLGKVTLAVLSLGISVAALLFTNADSHLTIVSTKNVEVLGSTSSSESTTIRLALLLRVKNTGLRSDFIDHIQIRSAKLDETIKSEPVFVDKELIEWRQTKDLRFELLVSSNLSNDEKAFVLTLYDSKGRQVGEEVRLSTTLTRPSEKALSAGKQLAYVVRSRVSVLIPEPYRDPNRLFFASLLTASGHVVGRSNPDGVLEKGGRADLSITILSRINHSMGVIVGFQARPQPPADVRFPVTIRNEMSDGTNEEFRYELSTGPDVQSRTGDPHPP